MIIKKLLLTKRTIRELKKCGLTYKELSKSFDCTVETIWNWLNKTTINKNKRGRKNKINDNMCSEIVNYIEKNVTVTQSDISLHKDRPIILCRPKNDVASFTPASLVQIQDLAV